MASANARVPGSIIVPGLEMVIEIDPDGLQASSTGITNRLPPIGRTAVEVQEHLPSSSRWCRSCGRTIRIDRSWREWKISLPIPICSGSRAIYFL